MQKGGFFSRPFCLVIRVDPGVKFHRRSWIDRTAGGFRMQPFADRPAGQHAAAMPGEIHEVALGDQDIFAVAGEAET